jgi:hypothetical protein
MRRYDQKHQMLLPDSVNPLIRDVLFNPDLINLLWFVLYCVNRLLFEKHFQCSYLNSKGQEAAMRKHIVNLYNIISLIFEGITLVMFDSSHAFI